MQVKWESLSNLPFNDGTNNNRQLAFLKYFPQGKEFAIFMQSESQHMWHNIENSAFLNIYSLWCFKMFPIMESRTGDDSSSFIVVL